MALIGAGKLPDGWPTSVPIPPAAQITSSASTQSAKVVTFETADAVEGVSDWYKSNLNDWTKGPDAAIAGSHILKMTNGPATLQIVVNKTPSGTTHTTLTIESA